MVQRNCLVRRQVRNDRCQAHVWFCNLGHQSTYEHTAFPVRVRYEHTAFPSVNLGYIHIRYTPRLTHHVTYIPQASLPHKNFSYDYKVQGSLSVEIPP